MLDSDLPKERDDLDYQNESGPENGSDDLLDGADAQSGPHSGQSMTDDISALFDDGKTYVEAEIAYQKTRLAFAANRGKSGLIYVLAALGFLHLALIGLVVGGIISLIPLIGPFFATLVVVGVLMIGVLAFLFAAKGKFSSLSDAFKDHDQ